MTRVLSVIIPAFNEERNLADTVAGVRREVAPRFDRCEILVVDDGSTDRTGEIAQALAREGGVRLIHNRVNRGLGFSYFRGVAEATGDYVVMIPGDNEIRLEDLEGMWALMGQADMVVPYTSNPEARPWSRRTFTRFGTWFLNGLFGLRLPYYNGCVVHRLEILRSLRVENHGFLYQGEILIRLLKRGATFVAVGIPVRPRPSGRSKVLKPRNVRNVLGTILRLFWTVRVRGRV